MSNENDGWETIEVSEDSKEVEFEIEEEEEQPKQDGSVGSTSLRGSDVRIWSRETIFGYDETAHKRTLL